MSDTFSAFKLAYELFIFFVQKGAKKIEKSENISKTKSLIKVLSYSWFRHHCVNKGNISQSSALKLWEEIGMGNCPQIQDFYE